MTSDRLECQFLGDIAIVRPRDQMPTPENVEEIRTELHELLNQDSLRDIVLNFEEVDYFEANLRGVLARLARELAKRDGHLVLCSLSDAIRQEPSIEIFGKVCMTIVEGQDDAIRVLKEGNALSYHSK